MRKLQELWWYVVLGVLQVGEFFFEDLVPMETYMRHYKGQAVKVRTRNIFAAYVLVKRLNAAGLYAEWEPG